MIYKYVIRKRCSHNNTEKWYYAYTIEGDTVTVVDACHAQNMHEQNKQSKLVKDNHEL